MRKGVVGISIAALIILLMNVIGTVSYYVAIQQYGSELKIIATLEKKYQSWNNLYFSEMQSKVGSPNFFNELKKIKKNENLAMNAMSVMKKNDKNKANVNKVESSLTKLINIEKTCEKSYARAMFSNTNKNRLKKIQSINCIQNSLRSQIAIHKKSVEIFMKLKNEVR